MVYVYVCLVKHEGAIIKESRHILLISNVNIDHHHHQHHKRRQHNHHSHQHQHHQTWLVLRHCILKNTFSLRTLG